MYWANITTTDVNSRKVLVASDLFLITHFAVCYLFYFVIRVDHFELAEKLVFSITFRILRILIKIKKLNIIERFQSNL